MPPFDYQAVPSKEQNAKEKKKMETTDVDNISCEHR
jgi:hypothetical protein